MYNGRARVLVRSQRRPRVPHCPPTPAPCPPSLPLLHSPLPSSAPSRVGRGSVPTAARQMLLLFLLGGDLNHHHTSRMIRLPARKAKPSQ